MNTLRSSLGQMTAGAVVALVVMNLASQCMRAAGWWLLLGPAHRLPADRLIRYEFAAQAATALTPEGSGEALRLWWLAREGVPATTTTAIIFTRKLISGLGLLPFVLSLPLLLPLPSWALWTAAGYTVLLLGLAALLLIVVYRRTTSGSPGGRVRRLGRRLLDGLVPIRNLRVVLGALTLAFATRAMDVAAAWLICIAFDLPFALGGAILSLLFIEISNVLPTAPAQLGSFHAAAALAVRAAGASDTAGFAYAVTLHAQQLFPQVLVGLIPLLGAGAARRHKTLKRTESVQ